MYARLIQVGSPLARILERYQIKTVLSLRNLDVADEREELEILAGRGVVFRRVSMRALDPIPEALARVEEAVQIVADEQNHPVFVHCTAGMHRTGAVIAAYRFSYCGWSEEQALAELRRYANRSDETDWACKVFRAYCQRTGN
jgi:tyrosine-protein phosphatase SIW14